MRFEEVKDSQLREPYVATTYVCSHGAVPLIDKSPSLASDEQAHEAYMRKRSENMHESAQAEHGESILSRFSNRLFGGKDHRWLRAEGSKEKTRQLLSHDEGSAPRQAGTQSVLLPDYFTDTRIICPNASSKGYSNLLTLIECEKLPMDEALLWRNYNKCSNREAVESSLGGKANMDFAKKLISYATAVESACDNALRGPARLAHPIFEPCFKSDFRIDSYPGEYVRATETGLKRLKDLVTDTVARLNTSQNTDRPIRHEILSAWDDKIKYPHAGSRVTSYDPFEYTTSLIKSCRALNPNLDLTRDIRGDKVVTYRNHPRRSTNFTVLAVPYLVRGIHPPSGTKKISEEPQRLGSRGRLFVKYIQSGDGGSMQDWLKFDRFRAAFEKSLKKREPVQDHETVWTGLQLDHVVALSEDWEASLEQYVQDIFYENRLINPHNLSSVRLTGQELSKIRPGTASNCYSRGHRKGANNGNRLRSRVDGREGISSDAQEAHMRKYGQAVWESILNLHPLAGGSCIRDYNQQMTLYEDRFPTNIVSCEESRLRRKLKPEGASTD
ncbi:hypothetical protein I302_100927 [Kwoniella bestiolae CBS 10118]|uniref:Uncharacterized protein n=1 Tax=Kwoniella bestiolae CBS 10118 TaxID=1296100 RepID=A0AAJ8K0Q2_9TREE